MKPAMTSVRQDHPGRRGPRRARATVTDTTFTRFWTPSESHTRRNPMARTVGASAGGHKASGVRFDSGPDDGSTEPALQELNIDVSRFA